MEVYAKSGNKVPKNMGGGGMEFRKKAWAVKENLAHEIFSSIKIVQKLTILDA
jgi:hypothetical protein